jgi:hypothetical protein
VNGDPLSIAPGESRELATAGLGLRIHVDPRFPGRLRLSKSFGPFLVSRKECDLELLVSSAARISKSGGTVLRDSGLHWRALGGDQTTVFEFVHPPTGILYCQARADRSFARFEILLSESAIHPEAPPDRRSRDFLLPHPLEQLLLVPALAVRGAVLFHACGAVIINQGLVFAGHSGEGKTTLGRILESEGALLLSDERIAVRRAGAGLIAFGTPWPGDGNAVSNAAHPLGGMFVLRKAARHALGPSCRSLAPELIARAIVPYYLPEAAEAILDTFSVLASRVPIRELSFARAPGLKALLEEIGSRCVPA